MFWLCLWLALSPRVFLNSLKYKHKKEDTFAKIGITDRPLCKAKFILVEAHFNQN